MPPSSNSSPDSRKSLIVTISGRPGSGKSVVAARVAEALGLDHVSAGDFMREMARARGVSILELSQSAEEDAWIDREIDARSTRLAESGREFVMDARLGWYFVPQSLKVFLEVRPEVAAKRVFDAGRGSEAENVSLEATRAAIKARTGSERERYLTYYGIDYSDPQHYDLVIDTSRLTADAVVDRILEFIRKRWLAERDD